MESAVLEESTPSASAIPKTREQLMSELRTLIPALGVRESARQLGMSENTALSWAMRYGWTDDPKIKAAIERVPRAVPAQSVAINGGQIMANAVREEILQTRISHARVARRAAQALEQKTDAALIDAEYAPTVLTLGKHAALVGGWNADSRPDSPGKAFGSRNSGLEIDAEVLDAPQPEENADIPPIPDGVSTNVDDY